MQLAARSVTDGNSHSGAFSYIEALSDADAYAQPDSDGAANGHRHAHTDSISDPNADARSHL